MVKPIKKHLRDEASSIPAKRIDRSSLCRCLFNLTIGLAFIFLTGCVTHSEKPPPHVRQAHKFMKSFAKELKREFGIACTGFGGGMASDIEEIELEFTAFRPSTIAEARYMEIEGIKKLLAKINADEEIRPYLKEYPFPLSRAHLSIAFPSPREKREENGKLAMVFSAKGKIFYCTFDSGSQTLTNLFSESFEDACQRNGGRAE